MKKPKPQELQDAIDSISAQIAKLLDERAALAKKLPRPKKPPKPPPPDEWGIRFAPTNLWIVGFRQPSIKLRPDEGDNVVREMEIRLAMNCIGKVGATNRDGAFAWKGSKDAADYCAAGFARLREGDLIEPLLSRLHGTKPEVVLLRRGVDKKKGKGTR